MKIPFHKKAAAYAVAFGILVLLTQIASIGKAVYTNAGRPITDWGLSFQNGSNEPVPNLSAEYLAQYDSLYRGPEGEKAVYLTFDCGFHNENVEKVLDILKTHDIAAAFFIVGHYVNSVPEMVERMAQDGHLVCNHTYKHPDMTKLSGDLFSAQLLSLENICKEKTGVTAAKFYRPPAGKFNEVNLTEAKNLGYKTVFWSVAYADWDEKKQPTPQNAMDTLTSRVHNGAIILLHPTASVNAKILDGFISQLKSQGYEFRTLDQI